MKKTTIPEKLTLFSCVMAMLSSLCGGAGVVLSDAARESGTEPWVITCLIGCQIVILCATLLYLIPQLLRFSREIYPITVQGEKGTRYQSQGDQRASSHEDLDDHRIQELLASFSAEPPASLSDHRTGEEAYIADEFARARAQRIRKRGAAIEASFRQWTEEGRYARHGLACHIYRSVPTHIEASPSILSRSWFAIHYKAAEFALDQADQAARRLGLKHVADTADFVARHCGWYLSFCTISSFLFGKAEDVKNAPLG